MKYILLLAILISMPISGAVKLDDWGRTGHRVTGEIATAHLSKKAKRAIDVLLNGDSLAMISTYGDEIKSDKRYGKYWAWHFVNFPFGSKYESHPKSDRGDLIMGIDTCVRILKDPASSREEKAFHLKMLVHFVGDLHQPLHIGQAGDKGGNDFQVRWFDEGTNLHTVWDTKMIESYNMSYSELASNRKRLSNRQIEEIQKGSVLDWMYESRALCEDIYQNTKIGEKLGYTYMYKYVDVAKFQMQKGGIRLAKMLNDIFG